MKTLFLLSTLLFAQFSMASEGEPAAVYYCQGDSEIEEWNITINLNESTAELFDNNSYQTYSLNKPSEIYPEIYVFNALQPELDMSEIHFLRTLGADNKGTIYEGLLEKNAEDTKSGAGQYFTPRALIRAMVECIQPEPMKTIADPASGTGGFFLAAYDFIAKQKLDKTQKHFLKHETFFGNEIVPNTRRMCLMNLFLHNIGDFESENFISPADALISDSGLRVDYVLANPPFGRKSSMTATNEEGEQETDELTYNRQDFWETSSNKQLNFVQHIRTMLKSTGQAAVVLPDNVLFEGGAGETVRKKLMETTDLHTILRLPTGIFYKQGVKANVLFFDNKPAAKQPWTKDIWIYDFRTNIHFTLKKNPLKLEDLLNFKAFTPEMVMLLEGAIKARLNMIISGGTSIGSGRKAAVDYTDYEAVKAYYNLKD